ncbi:MAG: NADH-quinone oxidoreductase subunit L [Eggerthellaceae bacterium]|nr:NADH-quinone oxidoreductase subunit L [Eggerthellaceae bacterium]MCH4220583.1 NADH-quinone oxidoreductase subunit L [Eggerthellaceae bacterium]
MELICFLIVFPLIVAALLLFVRDDTMRSAIVGVSACAIGIGSVVLCALNLGTQGQYFAFDSVIVDDLGPIISILIAACIITFAVRYRNIWAGILAAIQVVLSLVFEFFFAHGLEVTDGLYLDSLSLLMACIIGVVGSGICVYALGYMKDFQKSHSDEKDRRPIFFAIMFLFLSAMFAIVFCNNMTWLFTAWEITTVCSFLLIGYTKTDEAIHNAFRQIIMNIAGGIGFIFALFYSASVIGTLDFNQFIAIGMFQPALLLFPITCLAFAGLTKAAQMPFHTWLLGAMVAPTPTSALLHSSTMVKAGVFLLIKISPVLQFLIAPQAMVILIGALSFCLCSFMAISQSNAKRVLAYSTIANLGLIVACAGVGSPEAIWAACFLILFHAVAKSLLFLCVGTAEHHIGSRNIEDMDLLFERMPHLARFMMIGIMCMFIAPFGMLVAKWATLVSFIDARQVILLILLAFGSAATFMFWAKWLGKLSGIAGSPKNVEITVHKSEWLAIGLMGFLSIACCAGLPFLSSSIVMPYISGVYGLVDTGIDQNLLIFTAITAVAVVIVVLAGLSHKSNKRQVDIYLSGVSADNAQRTYHGAMNHVVTATSRNLYLDSIFGEKKMTPVGDICCSVLIIGAFMYSLYTLIPLI